jgi:hypothetical protein
MRGAVRLGAALLIAASLPAYGTACGGGGQSKQHVRAKQSGGKRRSHPRQVRHRKARLPTGRQRAAAGCPAGLVPQGTEACVRPGGAPAGCGGNPYSTPSRYGGCIGPAHPPSTGRATHCPPGQRPAGDTGACAPSSAGAPSVDSAEGQRELRENPDCRNVPPPPPSYHGPVQC